MQRPANLPKHVTVPNPAIYEGNNYVVIDFETTNLDRGSALTPGNNTVLSVHRRTGGAFNSVWGSEFEQQGILDSISGVDFIVAHNAKFELQWLARIGADLTKIVVWDTMIAEYVIAGNRKWPLDLSSVAERYGLGQKQSVVSSMIGAGVCPSVIPPKWLEEYCKRDVELTHEIFKRQLHVCRERGLCPTVFTRCLLTPVLADIEKNGMQLDTDVVLNYYNKCTEELAELRAELADFAEGINWNSSAQVSDFLYGTLNFAPPKDFRGNEIKTAGGKYSTASPVIATLRPRNGAQRKFLQLYKQLSKAEDRMSKYLSKFLACITDDGGILYANFNQTVTRTHRLSSSGKKHKVQFQNYERTLKNVIKARHPGWCIGEADGASLEFRVAAHLGRDARASQDIDARVDVHAFTASILNGCDTSNVTKDQRQAAKAHTFKPLYGGQSGTDAQQKYYVAFREKYPGIAKTQNRWIMGVLERKQLVTETGLIFYWPSTAMKRSGYIINRESICNYPVQSLATADIIPIALVYQWHYMKALGMQSFIINTVHDSTPSEVSPEETELFKDVCVQCYTTEVYRYLHNVYHIDFTVNLGVGYKIGDHWGTGEEDRIDVLSPYRGQNLQP